MRLIKGGRGVGHRLGPVRIVPAPEDQPPFPVDALAVEDDTYFVLGADPEVREPNEHPIRLWKQIHEAEPAAPGSVSVKEGEDGGPTRFLAVVHDLSQEPSWREEWVAQALGEVLRETGQRKVYRRAVRGAAEERA
jgi:hypothetical protein